MGFIEFYKDKFTEGPDLRANRALEKMGSFMGADLQLIAKILVSMLFGELYVSMLYLQGQIRRESELSVHYLKSDPVINVETTFRNIEVRYSRNHDIRNWFLGKEISWTWNPKDILLTIRIHDYTIYFRNAGTISVQFPSDETREVSPISRLAELLSLDLKSA